MADMIERAARAMCASQLYASAWDGLNEGAQKTFRVNARAALFAALDPEDEALVTEMAKAIALDVDRNGKPIRFDAPEREQLWSVSGMREKYLAMARAALSVLKSHAAQERQS